MKDIYLMHTPYAIWHSPAMMYISQVVGIGAQRQCSNLSSPFGELYIIGIVYG
ncbi:hypothetical protein [Winogradskyella flava]|uniref:hypothetical protein n=1 Tax=Winogradskyella flava TaxID=1884876 RepID=UPI0024902012|nr:hypothetical protein [Winogradskyella flava]